MFRLPGTVDAALAKAFRSTVLSCCKARAIFFIAFGLFASAKDILLDWLRNLLHLRHHPQLHLHATTTAKLTDADLILSLKAFAFFPLAFGITSARMFNIARRFLGLALIESLRSFERIVIVILIVVFLVIGGVVVSFAVGTH